MTTIQEKIERVRELVKKREGIDAELAELFAGGSVTKKTNKCGICGQEGHSARTCPNKEEPKPAIAAPKPAPQSAPASTQPTSFMSKIIGNQ
jgi:hypothetical protein